MTANLRRIPRAPTAEEVGARSDLPVGNPAGATNRSTAVNDMERCLARFGARLVLERWLEFGTNGFIAPDSHRMDILARECGLMGEGYAPTPGLASAARLLAEPQLTDAERLEDLRQKFADMARALGLDVRLGKGGE